MPSELLRAFHAQCTKRELRHTINPLHALSTEGQIVKMLADPNIMASEKAELVAAFDVAFPSFLPVWCAKIEQGHMSAVSSINGNVEIILNDPNLAVGMASCALIGHKSELCLKDARAVQTTASAGISALVLNFALLEALVGFIESEGAHSDIIELIEEALRTKEEEIFPQNLDEIMCTMLCTAFLQFESGLGAALKGGVSTLLKHVGNPILTCSLRMCNVIKRMCTLPWASRLIDFAEIEGQHAKDMLPMWCQVVAESKRVEFADNSQTLQRLAETAHRANLDELVVSSELALATAVVKLLQHADTVSPQTVGSLAETAMRRGVRREREREPACEGCGTEMCEDCLHLVSAQLVQWCCAFSLVCDRHAHLFETLPDVLVDAVEVAMAARRSGAERSADDLSRALKQRCGTNYFWALHRVRGDDQWVARNLDASEVREDPITNMPIWRCVDLSETPEAFLGVPCVGSEEIAALQAGTHAQSCAWAKRRVWHVDRETMTRHLRNSSTNPFTGSKMTLDQFITQYPCAFEEET